MVSSEPNRDSHRLGGQILMAAAAIAGFWSAA